MGKKPGTGVLDNPLEEGVETDGDEAAENGADPDAEDGAEAEEGKEDAGGDGDGADGGAGEGEEGEDKGGEGDEVDDEEGDDAPSPEITELRESNRLLQERLDKLENGGDKKNEAAEKPPTRTPEEASALAEKLGTSKETIEWFDQQILGLAQSLATYMKGALSKLEGDSGLGGMLDQLSKDKSFSNIKSHEKSIRQFLKDNVDPSKWMDKKILGIAYNYAKGLGADQKVKKATNSRELNRKVIKKSSSRGGAPKPAVSKKKISAEDDSIRRRAGISVADWNDLDKPVSELI